MDSGIYGYRINGGGSWVFALVTCIKIFRDKFPGEVATGQRIINETKE